MEYISGTARNQLFLFNQCLDEIIDKNHIVRFINAYVDSLDKFFYNVPRLLVSYSCFSFINSRNLAAFNGLRPL